MSELLAVVQVVFRRRERSRVCSVCNTKPLLHQHVEGTNVYDLKGSKVGEIDHLMIDKISSRVTNAVMSFGGFLGLGHSHYPLPWAA